MKIGDWVKRWGGKWHLVESVVDGDAITRCGRRMGRTLSARVNKDSGRLPSSVLEVSEVMPLTRMIGQPQLCKGGCDRPGMVVGNNEDNGSTWTEP